MSDFLYPIPKSVCLHMLRSESRSRGYSDPAVRISVLLDVDAGSQRSQREYADIWGWTRKKVRHHWKAIWEDVADWCSSYGRQMNSPMVEKLPLEWKEHLQDKYPENEGPTRGPGRGPLGAQKTAIPAQIGHIGDRVGAHEGPTRGQHTIHPFPTSLHPEEKEKPPNPSGSAPKGAKAKPERVRFVPPSIEEALEYFAEMGRPDLADSFFDHFTSNGWKVGGKTAMKDWKAAARNWIRNDKRFSSNGKQQHNGATVKRLTPANLDLYEAKRRAAAGGSRAA